MRDNPYSPETVDKIVQGFDVRLLDPLIVFQRPGGQYVIAGDSHSRFEALQRLAASGGAPGLDLSHIPVQVVDEATAHHLALRANSKSTPFKPMEFARVFQQEQQRHPDQTVRDIARAHSKTPSFVQQHLALNALPQAAQDAVRMGVMSPDIGGVFGSFIDKNSVAPEDASAIYERFIAPGDMTKNGLEVALNTLLKIPKPAQMGMGGMFGDEAAGGENYAQVLTDLAKKQGDLDAKRSALATIKRATKKVPGTAAVNPEALAAEIQATAQEIGNLQASLGQGKPAPVRAETVAGKAIPPVTAVPTPAPIPPVTAPPLPAVDSFAAARAEAQAFFAKAQAEKQAPPSQPAPQATATPTTTPAASAPTSGPTPAQQRIRAQIDAVTTSPAERLKAYADANVLMPGEGAGPPSLAAPVGAQQASRQRVQGENRQQRDEGYVLNSERIARKKAESEQRQANRQRIQAESRQQRDEGSVLRDQKRTETAEGRAQRQAEERQRRDENYYARQQRQIAAENARLGPSAILERDRRTALKEVADRFAGDPALRPHYNGSKHRLAEEAELKQRGLWTAADETGQGSRGPLASLLRRRGGIGLGAFLGAGQVVSGIGQAAQAGAGVGQAVGSVAQGLSQGVTAASSGFVHAGQTALALFLSPFGQTGSAATHIIGGLAGGLLSVLQGGGAIAAAGIQAGLSLAGGMLGGAAGILGAGLGAIIGSAIPGAGTLIGAGLGAALFGGIGTALSGLLQSLGGAIGDALAAIGGAAGTLLSSLGDALGSIQRVLSDLIATGRAFATASLSVGRTGNLSLAAAGGVGSLAQILTGSPGGLNGAYTGFANMSQYKGTQLRAFGVQGATGDPLPDILRAATAYRGLDPIRRQLLVQGGFGGNEAIGNLFEANRYAPGLAAEAVGVARRTAMTPQETVQDTRLGLHLDEAEMKLIRLKTTFLTSLMPAINAGLDTFGAWFDKNTGRIIGGLENVGRWFYSGFPAFVHQAVDSLFRFGESFLKQLPAVTEFFRSAYTEAATFGNILSSQFHLLKAGADMLLGISLLRINPFAAVNEFKVAGQEAAKASVNPFDPHAMDKTAAGLLKAQPDWLHGLQKDHKAEENYYQHVWGSATQRGANFDHLRHPAGSGTVHFQGDFTVKSDVSIDLDRLQQTTETMIVRKTVRGIQRRG